MKQLILAMMVFLGCISVFSDASAAVMPNSIIEYNAQTDISNNIDQTIQF